MAQVDEKIKKTRKNTGGASVLGRRVKKAEMVGRRERIRPRNHKMQESFTAEASPQRSTDIFTCSMSSLKI
jgi:hypothetical protein